MSVMLPCPFCGPRPLEEFAHAEILRVPEHIEGTDARDVDRGFMSSNPEGPVVEQWFHTYGCRRWIRLERNTKTDELEL